MSSRVEKERAKQIQDKCQNLLTQMLRDEDNKYCVDCDAKGPRWASWNLGIFLCIRCAGIHRNLGVHISRVKSVNLDTWTPEQVVSLQQMGNSRARAVYEANLPDSFRRPHTDCSLESFIRAKYEHKKYIAREWVPPPVQKVNWDKELDEEAERQRRRKKESIKSNSSSSNQSAALPPVKKPEVVPQLPKPRSSVSPKPNKTSNSATLDLLGLDAPTANQSNANGSGDDIFSSFLSAPPAAGNNTSTVNGGTTSTANSTTTTSTNQAASKTEEENFFNQTAPTAQERSKMTKDSILALYGTPSHQQSVFGAPAGMYSQQQIPNMGAFSQPSNFPNQQSSLNQLNHIPSQLAMPIPNQMAVNPNQIGAIAANPVGAGAMHMGQINQMNGLPNTAMVMQTQMGVANVDPQMMQLGQQANVVGSNNGWTGMIAQNLQPAPGSNPFFNLATQQQPTNAFVTQLPQQMSQMSLSGGLGSFPSPAGKPAATAAFPGQTLSTNLWQ